MEEMFIVKHSEQLPTKQVSLDDLKRAVERYESARDDGDIRIEIEWQRYGEAWRAAFEWREKFADVWSIKEIDEHHEGMRLIREKLR